MTELDDKEINRENANLPIEPDGNKEENRENANLPIELDGKEENRENANLPIEPDGKDENFEDNNLSSSLADSANSFKRPEINFNNPCTWFPMTDKVKTLLVENGPDQGMNADFKASKQILPNKKSYRFHHSWFTKIIKNGEQITRKWLMYCKERQCLYCFPCLLFDLGSQLHQTKLCNPNKGFNNWKKLSPKIENHEKNSEHQKNYFSWREFEQRLKAKATIDSEVQRQLEAEKQKWRYILKAIVGAILFCAENNLPLRGHREGGIFLNLMNLIAKHDAVIAEHLSNDGHVTYLSPQIQNEFINLLGKHVRDEIIDEIKKAKYFSIMFDCTPDSSRTEQMSQIIRYVDKNNNIQERFIDFIDTTEKTGEGLARVILEKLEDDGLNIENCRGQAYDNGANMAGINKGVQNRITSVQKTAKFISCAAHSLNLSGVHAASVSTDMVNFFGIVQQIYVFFSGSTTRWNLLTSHFTSKLKLKTHADTRWASKYNAVHALLIQFEHVFNTLKQISQDKSFSDGMSTAKGLLKLLNFDFVLYLTLWESILNHIHLCDKSLQKVELSQDEALLLTNALQNSITSIRDKGIDPFEEDAKKICIRCGITAEFKEVRSRKKKKLSGEASSDEVRKLLIIKLC